VKIQHPEITSKYKTYLRTSQFRELLSTLFLVASFLFSFVNFLNAMGLYPRVMRDEWYYSMHSRNVNLDFAEAPNYLYLYLMKGTSFCSDQFLACGRLFNYLALILSALLIINILKGFTTKSIGNITGAFILISPLGIYVNVFMPESFFVFFFILVIYSLFRLAAQQNFFTFLVYALAYSLLILIKPHALFLIPSFVVATYTLFRLQGGSTTKKYALHFSFLGVGLAVTFKSILGYIFAGKAGLSLMGVYVVGLKNPFLAQPFESIAHAMTLSKGLLFPVISVFGFCLFAFASTRIKSDSPSKAQVSYLMIRNFSYAGTLTLVPIMAAISTVLAQSNEYELSRIHERYINYFFPIYLITFALLIKLEGKKLVSGFNIAINAVIASLAIVVVTLDIDGYSFNSISSPFAQGLVSPQIISFGVAVTMISLIAIFSRKQKIAINLYFFLVIPLIFVSTTQANQESLSMHRYPYKYDQAATFTQNLMLQFPEKLNGKLVVVGPEIAGIYQVLMKIDRFDISFRQVQEGESLAQLAEDFDLILTIGSYPELNGSETIHKTPIYSLYNTGAIPFSP
jgi:phosphoglycerol transferase